MATKMDKSPAFLLYTDKFFTGCADMQPETVGIYIRLLCKLWNLPDGLPSDVKKLARLALVSEKVFIKSWESDFLCEKFILNDKSNLTNDRLEIVREKRLEKSTKARESILKRWQKDDAEIDTNVLQSNSERITNDIHISKVKISKENISNIDSGVATPPTSPKVDKVAKAKPERKVFIKPEWKEVANYMFEHLKTKNQSWPKEKLQVEAEKFINHYTTNGWKVGKNQMVDWKAATRNWILNAGQFETFNTPQQQPSQPLPRIERKALSNEELREQAAKALGA
jgi:uncharacterized protein YdaU (DUF1376 family)